MSNQTRSIANYTFNIILIYNQKLMYFENANLANEFQVFQCEPVIQRIYTEAVMSS